MMEANNTDLQKKSYKCSICNDTFWFTDETGKTRECKCKNKIAREYAIGELARIELMSIQPISQQQKKALDIIQKFPYESYLFTGNIRTGKTYIMAGIFNYVYENYTRKCKWFSDYELKQYFIDVEMNRQEDLVLKIRKGELKMIFLDDLGKATASDTYLQGLFHLIDEVIKRKDNIKMCFTSILPLEEMAKIFGISSTRRIEDIVKVIFNLDEKKGVK